MQTARILGRFSRLNRARTPLAGRVSFALPYAWVSKSESNGTSLKGTWATVLLPIADPPIDFGPRTIAGENEEHCIWRAPGQYAGESRAGSTGALQIQF